MGGLGTRLRRRNRMKTIIGVFVLLLCVSAVLLATVDLEPYLGSKRTPIAQNDVPPSKPETNKLQDKADATGEPDIHPMNIIDAEPTINSPQLQDAQPEGTLKIPATGQAAETSNEPIAEEETAGSSLPANTGEALKGGKEGNLELISSSLIDMEATILPVGEYPFSILLETFSEEPIAELAIPYYQKKGISAYLVKVDLGEKGIQYRLFTGVFATAAEAQQFLDQKQLTDKPIKPTVYSARIGSFQDKDQLANAYIKTIRTGVVPYILGTQEGIYQLYAGAFYTFIGATAQCRDLTEAGLSCEPIKRSTVPPENP